MIRCCRNLVCSSIFDTIKDSSVALLSDFDLGWDWVWSTVRASNIMPYAYPSNNLMGKRIKNIRVMTTALSPLLGDTIIAVI